MFYTYILRSISHQEQRYIGSTSDLKSRLAIRRFFFACKNKRSATERAKDAWKFILNSFSGGGSLGDGGLTAENWRKTNVLHLHFTQSFPAGTALYRQYSRFEIPPRQTQRR
ncbi:MAG: GIY-YIG nuclease family protein [Lentisphaeria bacterium]|nr:GIY-YIG nuclease family protein [Lentisphaeria bacterium]